MTATAERLPVLRSVRRRLRHDQSPDLRRHECRPSCQHQGLIRSSPDPRLTVASGPECHHCGSTRSSLVNWALTLPPSPALSTVLMQNADDGWPGMAANENRPTSGCGWSVRVVPHPYVAKPLARYAVAAMAKQSRNSTAGSSAATSAPRLVCLDEVGYLNMPDRAPSSSSNPLGTAPADSLIASANLPFGVWTKGVQRAHAQCRP